MSNLPTNRQPTSLANKPANMPALGPGQPLQLRPKTMEEAMRLADLVAKSSFCPKSFRDRDGRGNAGDILIVVLQCEELDITLLQGLSGIAVINGTPRIWGDLGPALVLRSGLCEYFLDDWDEATQTSIVRIKRRGKVAREFTFSWDDAVKAGLSAKDTYKLYRKDMCTWKAKTRAMRTEFPDVLKGMAFVEDALGVDAMVEPEPIQMPREIGAPAPEPHYQDQPQASDDPQPAIFVAKVDEKQYTDQKTGKLKSYFVVEFSDGATATTFSESVFELVADACTNRKPVLYTAKAGKKEGSFLLDTFKIAAPPAPADDPRPDPTTEKPEDP